MGKNTKLICTIMPNYQKTAENTDQQKKHFFSLFISPRLPESGRLLDYFEIANWDRFQELFRGFEGNNATQLKFTLAAVSYTSLSDVGKDEPVSEYKIDATHKSYPAIFDQTELGKIRKESSIEDFTQVYKKVFPVSTPVSGWLLDEGTADASEVKQIITHEDLQYHNKNLPVTVAVESLFAKSKDSQEEISISIAPVQAFMKDIEAYKLTEDEVSFANKENQEFHKKLSMISDYPHLLRMMGWVHDFYVQADELGSELAKLGDRAVIKLEFPGFSELPAAIMNSTRGDLWRNFFNEVDLLSPWTYIDPKLFSVRYAEALKDHYFDVAKGFLRPSKSIGLEASQFSLTSSAISMLADLPDTEREKLSSMNSANTLAGAAESNSSGIGVYFPGRITADLSKASPAELNGRLNAGVGPGLENANINDYIIFGHHLDVGYRVDAAEEGGQLLSLCLRNADYAIDRSPTLEKSRLDTFMKGYNDEPWVTESAQGGKSGTLYVSEELFRWNNWSLTCPQIGDYKTDDDNNAKYIFNDLELRNIRPQEAGLPSLYFGKKYFFRIRVVDLCGNSADLNTSRTMGAEFNIEMKNPYTRLERIEPPEVFFYQTVFITKKIVRNYREAQPDGSFKTNVYREEVREWKPGAEGENEKVMVIRSMVNKTGQIISGKISCSRMAAPPRVTPQLAALHEGAFDQKGELENYYELLVQEKEQFEQIVQTGTKNTSQIPFVTDPNVNGVLLVLSGSAGISSSGKANFSTAYLQRSFVRISLAGGSVALVNKTLSGKKEELEVHLPAGMISHGNLYPVIKDPGLQKHAGKIIDPAGLKLSVGESQGMIFVHAVQRPVLLDRSGLLPVALTPQDRSPETPVQVHMVLSSTPAAIPMATTGFFRLVAHWFMLERDPENADGSGYRYAHAENVIAQGFSNLAELRTPDQRQGHQEVLRFGTEKADQTFLRIFDQLQHSFGDTQHRKVRYTLELESRFKAYFSQHHDTDFFITSMPLVNELGKEEHIVKSSTRPRSLQIDRIVHLIDWKTVDNYDGQNYHSGMKTVTRSNTKFRVYFKDEEWFTSGPDESIALIYADSMHTIPDELTGLVSEFGVDPAVRGKTGKGARLTTDGIHSNMLKGKEIQFGTYSIAGKNMQLDFIDSRLLAKEKSRFAEAGSVDTKKGYQLSARTYKVRFDGRHFYADIELAYVYVMHYFPFLKLALARCQENSIVNYQYNGADAKDRSVLAQGCYDYRFSSVVMAPAVQVLPIRCISVHNDGRIEFPEYLNHRSPVSRFFLIMERHRESEFVGLIKDHRLSAEVDVRPLDGSAASIFIETRDLKGYEAAYFEEYEYYSVDDQFVTTEPNPRNNIRMRLVYAYKIK